MKKEIIERLLKAEQITFDEAILLLEREVVRETTIITQPHVPYAPVNPAPWWIGCHQITC